MPERLHLIMPMAGKGSRFAQKGFSMPKPLIELNGKPFFYWATQSIIKFVDVEDITFVVLREHQERFGIIEKVKSYYENAKFQILSDVLNGAVLSCLQGVQGIQDRLPIVFNDCDHLFHCQSFYTFCQNGFSPFVDGALLTFISQDPKFSYVRYDSAEKIIGTKEKQVVSQDAICGAYYFRNKDIFQTAAEKYLTQCDYQEFYMSGVYNVLAEKGQQIKNFSVDFHLPFGTPEEYKAALGSSFFEEVN